MVLTHGRVLVGKASVASGAAVGLGHGAGVAGQLGGSRLEICMFAPGGMLEVRHMRKRIDAHQCALNGCDSVRVYMCVCHACTLVQGGCMRRQAVHKGALVISTAPIADEGNNGRGQTPAGGGGHAGVRAKVRHDAAGRADELGELLHVCEHLCVRRADIVLK